jgi:hypothetical protein
MISVRLGPDYRVTEGPRHRVVAGVNWRHPRREGSSQDGWRVLAPDGRGVVCGAKMIRASSYGDKSMYRERWSGSDRIHTRTTI